MDSFFFFKKTIHFVFQNEAIFVKPRFLVDDDKKHKIKKRPERERERQTASSFNLYLSLSSLVLLSSGGKRQKKPNRG